MKVAKIKTFIEWTVKIIIPIAAVVISIAAIFISRTSNSIAQMELERADFARPIIYEFAHRDVGTMYRISDGDTVRYVPAVELAIDVTMGALASITVFHYDGHTLHYINTPDLPRIVTPAIQIRIPSNPNPLIDNGVFYDYMFVLMTPIEGSPVLYMFCVEVDIYNGKLLREERFNKYNLLELALNKDICDTRRHMLEAYYELFRQIGELGLR